MNSTAAASCTGSSGEPPRSTARVSCCGRAAGASSKGAGGGSSSPGSVGRSAAASDQAGASIAGPTQLGEAGAAGVSSEGPAQASASLALADVAGPGAAASEGPPGACSQAGVFTGVARGPGGGGGLVSGGAGAAPACGASTASGAEGVDKSTFAGSGGSPSWRRNATHRAASGSVSAPRLRLSLRVRSSRMAARVSDIRRSVAAGPQWRTRAAVLEKAGGVYGLFRSWAV